MPFGATSLSGNSVRNILYKNLKPRGRTADKRIKKTELNSLVKCKF
jgi:hypothetical protein